MKIILFVFVLLFSSPFSVFAQTKKETAIITCNIISEIGSGAERIREIVAARKEIGESAFLGTSSDINEALEYNLCMNWS